MHGAPNPHAGIADSRSIPLQLSTLEKAPADWDAYVLRHPEATAYHLAAAVELGREVFGLRTYYLVAHDDGAIVGVLPLVEQSSRLFGHFLVSVPFFTYGGVLADSREIAEALTNAASDVGKRVGVDHVELRHRGSMADFAWPVRLDKVSLVLNLPATEAELGKRLGAKLRSQVKRAEREKPELSWGDVELVPEFYEVFARSMHELGTPVYPRRFFEAVCRAMPGLMKVLVVRVDGKVQAAAIVVRHGESIEVPWAAATGSAKRNSINMRMYWEMLLFAVRSGAKTFDFGRSSVDSGTYRFKMQWGATPEQLYWHYWLPGGRQIPQLNHANPKYAAAAAVWSRMPLWCANLIGPMIVRNLP